MEKARALRISWAVNGLTRERSAPDLLAMNRSAVRSRRRIRGAVGRIPIDMASRKLPNDCHTAHASNLHVHHYGGRGMLDRGFHDHVGVGVMDRPIRRRQRRCHVVAHPDGIGDQEQLQ